MSPVPNVVDVLTNLGPSLSSAIAEELVLHGHSDSSARKMIQRAKSPVERLTKVRFPHNRQFLFLDGQRREERFWKHLLRAFLSTGSSYGQAVSAILANGGIIPKAHFVRSSGLAQGIKNQMSPGNLMENLIDLGFLERDEIIGLGQIIKIGKSTPFQIISDKRIKSLLLAEDIFLSALKEWLQKNSIGSYNGFSLRKIEELPSFAHAEWDLMAPSYLLPLADRKPSKPGFIVADVIFNTQLSENAIKYFINKCNGIYNRPNNRPFIPILVGLSFSREALSLGRSAGIMLTTPGNMLGDDIAAGLKTLISVLENAAANAAAKPEIIGELFSKLGRIEGAAGNLRGPLFEMIVGHCVREVEGNTVDIGVTAINSKGDKADIDVLRVKGKQEICAYECKGIAPSKNVPLEEIEKWISITIPRIFDWIQKQERFQGARVCFEFWTTGEFEVNSLRKLEEHKCRTKRYDLEWRDGSSVLKYVKQIKSTRIEDILNENYLKHPLP